MIGIAAPDFSLHSVNEDIEVGLSNLKDKGKIIVLEFWSTSCTKCKNNTDKMKRMAKEYADKAEFVSISFDNDMKALNNYIEKEQLKWIQLYDPSSWQGRTSALYHIEHLPTFIVISKEGTIAAFDCSTKTIEKMLSE